MSGTNQEAILGQILTGISDLRREVYRLSDRLDNVERTEPNTPTAANFFSRVGGGYLDDLWRDLLDLATDHPTATTFARMKKGEKAERLEALFRGDGDLRSALAVTEEQAVKIAAWLPEGMK